MAEREDNMAVTLQRRRFTLDEYHRMGEAGILDPDCRVELVDGEIFEMNPINPWHSGVVNRQSRAMPVRELRR